MDTGSKGCCQAVEGVLSSLVGLGDSWGSWWVPAGQACGSRDSYGSKSSGLRKVRGGRGGGLPVSLEEILANHPAPQKREAALHQHCLQCRRGAVDLYWGRCRAVEGILRGFPQSHWHAFHRRSRGWGLRGWLIHHSSRSHWGSSEAPQWQGTRGGWDPPWVPQVSGCCGAVLADTSLQHHVAVRDSASGLANWGGGPSIQKGGLEGVFQLSGDHTPQPLWESLFQGTGEDNSNDSQTSDSGGTMQFLSWLWNTSSSNPHCISLSWWRAEPKGEAHNLFIFLPLPMVMKFGSWPKEYDPRYKWSKRVSSTGWWGAPLEIKPLLLHIERSQLRRLEHLYRMPPGRLPREVFLACPAGRRTRGRPRTRWSDYVTLGSSQKSWRKCPGRGKSGCPCSDSCPRKMDG